MEIGKNTMLSDRILRRLAWFLVGVFFILLTAGLALQVVTQSPLYGVGWLATILEAAVVCVFVVVGVLIVSRHIRHPVGWIWICLSILTAQDHFAWGYAYYGYILHPGSLPGVNVLIVWLYLQVRSTLGLLLITLLLLLFPTGRPLSYRWGLVAWIALGVVSVATLISVVAPVPFGYFPFPTDLLVTGEPARAVLGPLWVIFNLAATLCIPAATLSLLIRLRRARGVERQQLKWVAYAAAFLPFGLIIMNLGESGLTADLNGVWFLGLGLVFMGFSGIALASAIAIFRYRLWDIDIIIRRTLVYGALTATLAVLYLASIVLLQGLFVAVSGEQSAVAVVISTLVIAALFTPLRRRIQNDIDRRFYRKKYDAEKVVAVFSAGLREEVDIEQLSERFLAVVEETLQPERLSLWLRASGAGHIPAQQGHHTGDHKGSPLKISTDSS